MFILMTSQIERIAEIEDVRFVGVEYKGDYPSLFAAIEAALNAGLDLDRAVIETHNGARASVNDWIAVRIAGGDLIAG